MDDLALRFGYFIRLVNMVSDRRKLSGWRLRSFGIFIFVSMNTTRRMEKQKQGYAIDKGHLCPRRLCCQSVLGLLWSHEWSTQTRALGPYAWSMLRTERFHLFHHSMIRWNNLAGMFPKWPPERQLT